MSDPAAPGRKPRVRRWMVPGIVALTCVAPFAAAVGVLTWHAAADHARDQVKVEPIAATCGGRELRYGASADEDDELSSTPGFGVTDVDLRRGAGCTVHVEVHNAGSRSIDVLSRAHGYMSRNDWLGSPARVRALRGLEAAPVSDEEATDATVEDAFTLDPGDSVRVEWGVEDRPDACQVQGVFSASLVTFRVKTLGRTLTVDPGLTFSVRNLSRSKNCDA